MADGFFANLCDSDKMSGREKRQKFGDLDIVMTGFAGLRGSVTLACEKYEVLRKRYSTSFLEGAKKQERLVWQIPEAAPAGKSDGRSADSFETGGITGMFPISQGGVYAGLWNLGEAAGVGLRVYLEQIPIKQETVEICNFFDVNPYQMQSEGCALLLSENGGRLRLLLRERGIFSEVIGITTRDNDRVILHGEERQFLQKKYEDAMAAC